MNEEIKKGLDKISMKYDIKFTEGLRDKLVEFAEQKGGSITTQDIQMFFMFLLTMMKTAYEQENK